jgi:hypothetical protein
MMGLMSENDTTTEPDDYWYHTSAMGPFTLSPAVFPDTDSEAGSNSDDWDDFEE